VTQTSGRRAGFFCPALICALPALGIFLWVWIYAGHGFDFTDESYYLFWISNPFQYDWSVTQFGFVYHPLYRLLDGDIASLRRVNLLLVYGLSWAVADRYLGVMAATTRRCRWSRALLAAGFAASSLVVFSSWLLTPNYNTLTLQGLLIALLGLLGVHNAGTARALPSWLLLGIGGWLVFMGKPTSALALALLSACYLLLWGRRYLRCAGLAALTAALLLAGSALLIEGSVLAFVGRVRSGLDLGHRMLGADLMLHIFRLDLPKWRPFEWRLFQGMAALTALAGMAVALTGRKRVLALVLFVVVLVLGVWWMAQSRGLFWSRFGPFTGFFALLGVALGALLCGLLTQMPALRQSTTRTQIGTGLLCAALPYAYAFGTNSNYSQVATYAGFFWMLAALMLLHPALHSPRHMRVLVPIALIAMLVCATLLARGMAMPYRQPQALSLNPQLLEIGPPASPLWVNAAVADYVHDAVGSARQAGFAAGTPVIDLTGHSPGLVFALNGIAPGAPWLLGGYPGSRAFTEAVLARCSCQTLARAWLLLEPDGRRGIPIESLASFGAALSRDYIEAGRWEVAAGVGGGKAPRTQVLYQPQAESAMKARCEALRRGSTP